MVHPTNRFKLSVLACALSVTAAYADTELRYEMAYYSQHPGGAQIEAGDYAAAIKAAARHMRSSDFDTALVAATNLCVAHTVRRELDKAAPACESALKLARRADEPATVRHRAGAAIARALGNRGVLRAFAGDADGAARDFVEAMRKTREWDGPNRNLARLEQAAEERVAAARAEQD